ncbi:hypothetical protein LGQ03_07180 [Loktanella sp. TSTF-M6]|uniref:Uncharacterized protein n=1 Tax=Loktanella gaetbuli TaxID=2881335 RepID=A0ABS8BTF9_9RHOB|nr:hypothetical protein [Loktanella gaetbuli]MCB5199018.1 hypothetical protein [Loktanella gaetbuli]
MVNVSVPSGLRLAAQTQWRLVTNTTTSGRGLDGRQQFVSNESRYWAATYAVSKAWQRRATWGAFLAFLDALDGPSNTFTIALNDPNSPVPEGSTDGAVHFVFEGGQAVYDTTSGDAIILDPNPNPTVATSAPEGATIIQGAGVDTDLLIPGAVFSHNDFMYRVQFVNSGAIKFSPPLRATIAAGQRLDVRDPTIRVRLADDKAAERAHQFGQKGGVFLLDVVEAFDR